MPVRSWARRGIFSTVLGWFALLAAPMVAAAQGNGTVTGTVSDQQTGERLAGARVFAVGNLAVALTRGDGTYRITLPAGSHDLRVSAIGFTTGRATVSVTAGGTTTHDFTLERAAVALEEIAV